jgi:hypothetical protein
MIVIIAGMQRSGSTFTFNVVRELLEKRGGTAIIATNSMHEALALKGGRPNLVVKTHAPDQDMIGLIRSKSIVSICSIRKPEDAIASWIRAFGFSLESSISTFREWLKLYVSISNDALRVDFQEIEENPVSTIYIICNHCGLKINIFEAWKIWWHYRKSVVFRKSTKMTKDTRGIVDVGYSYYDDTTFFHRRHVSALKKSNASETLSKEQINYIRSELKEFIDKAGNINLHRP